MTDNREDDLELFREAMADVRPLPQDRVVLRPKPPKPIPRQRIADEERVMQELLTHDFDPEMLETGEELFHARPGLQRRVARKLRRGQYGIQEELDLHGLTVPLAHAALREFIAECRLRNLRCVRVIHGKGQRSSNRGPVLKTKVDRWLRQWDEVIAFCSARPRDGGTGAVYVLLRA
ncbi:DNA-nicking Smr family endonuclease [Natronocella acetinitrilica]|uniref:DNA-nicking Smr family endonuclease n=1 Tax=Natronocella acetinitrilica TaxID=414046 RepID=A0AAE3KCW8_9GAMM|nr:Smr/MutS family protein [Natronocella acetinitrilica]MCP1676174.1 DNA-nicking Smr family endonuclease [Natronocella acetinitrilica]